MKKHTRISVPRKVVLPLAAAALLAACDERSPSSYKVVSATSSPPGTEAPAKGRAASTRPPGASARRSS